MSQVQCLLTPSTTRILYRYHDLPPLVGLIEQGLDADIAATVVVALDTANKTYCNYSMSSRRLNIARFYLHSHYSFTSFWPKKQNK